MAVYYEDGIAGGMKDEKSMPYVNIFGKMQETEMKIMFLCIFS